MSQASRLRASNPAESMNGDVVPSGTGVNRAALTLVVVILLIIFASRVTRLNTLDMQQDEVWSVWQTLGTPQQVINWTPYDWSPTFYLIVDGWQNLTGIGPFTIRLLPIFVFLIGVALVYRITDKWYGARAAIMAILVFSALGYILFLSTLLRGYIFNLTLWLLALWLALRYFERPSWQRAVALCWPIILMFYIHLYSCIQCLRRRHDRCHHPDPLQTRHLALVATGNRDICCVPSRCDLASFCSGTLHHSSASLLLHVASVAGTSD